MKSEQRTRSGRRVIALALGVLLAILVVEGGVRCVRMLRGNAYDATAALMRADQLVARIKGLDFAPKAQAGQGTSSEMTLQPYEGYQLAKVLEEVEKPTDYWTSAEAGENYDVMLMGGSVAANFGNWSEQELFPLLAADPRLAGRKIVQHWRPCPGHKQPQHANTLQWALTQGCKPDLVLLIDGYNELAIAAENAQHGINPLFPYWIEMRGALASPLAAPGELELVGSIVAARQEAEQLVRNARDRGLMYSAILGSLVEKKLDRIADRADALLAKLSELEASNVDRRPLLLSGPAFTNEPASVLRSAVAAWMEGSRSMQAMCSARNIRFLHVLQPAARDKGSKPLTPQEDKGSLFPIPWRIAIEEGYPLLREAGARLVAEKVNFCDGSKMFADHPEQIYRDACHFEEAGSRIMAQFIAKQLFESWPKRD